MAFDMAKNGQKVVINYIQGCEEDALATVEECKKLGGDAFAIEADCSKDDQVQNLFKKAVEHFGTVDVLINNAGVTRDNLVARMKPAEWNLVLNINLTGVFYCMQEFFKIAAENGRGGRVINMASVVGQFGNPGQANYAASKGGVIGLSKSCAKEMAPYGVKVSMRLDCAWVHAVRGFCLDSRQYFFSSSKTNRLIAFAQDSSILPWRTSFRMNNWNKLRSSFLCSAWASPPKSRPWLDSLLWMRVPTISRVTASTLTAASLLLPLKCLIKVMAPYNCILCY